MFVVVEAKRFNACMGFLSGESFNACLEGHGCIVRRGAIGGVPGGGRCGTHGAVDGGGVLHAGDESSVGAMGRNPMTFSRRAPLKACFSPGLCPIGVGVLQACAPLKLHVISLWGSLWCVACFSPGLCPIEVARHLGILCRSCVGRPDERISESRTRLHCPCMS